MIHGRIISLATAGFSEIRDITTQVLEVADESALSEGIVNVFAIGSTASITTIEYEPALVADMEEALEKLWPKEMPTRHGSTWGDDNGFSHLRASFMGPGLTVPLHKGSLVLGTWQQIVVIDHDNNPRQREIFVQVVGQ
ncbi:MAG: secondary thiamine-phosphate synthase enzyme YjbQ [Gemmatimonadales bacterium]|nr:secondary thiamine-phosphate synthase enzyme YjbQ [Gemmatimonadales bacterium]